VRRLDGAVVGPSSGQVQGSSWVIVADDALVDDGAVQRSVLAMDQDSRAQRERGISLQHSHQVESVTAENDGSSAIKSLRAGKEEFTISGGAGVADQHGAIGESQTVDHRHRGMRVRQIKSAPESDAVEKGPTVAVSD